LFTHAVSRLFHGVADEVVQYQHATTTKSVLEHAGFATTLTAYEGMGHSASMEEVVDVIAWLDAIYGP
jgi:predicted esterase